MRRTVADRVDDSFAGLGREIGRKMTDPVAGQSLAEAPNPVHTRSSPPHTHMEVRVHGTSGADSAGARECRTLVERRSDVVHAVDREGS
jgi:hypothetical protein